MDDRPVSQHEQALSAPGELKAASAGNPMISVKTGEPAIISEDIHVLDDPAANGTDWNGPDDPDNPLNWPLSRRAYQTVAFGSLGFAVTTSSSIITPAIEDLERHFHISRTVAILPLTLYVLGLAFAPILAAPISETYGRNVVYKVSAPIFMLFLVGAAQSESIGALLACRIFAGLAGAPVLAVAAGSTADMYPRHHRALASTAFVTMPFLGPALGPVIGGFVAQYKGWRWTQYCAIFIGIVAFALVLPMKETYKKIILVRRRQKQQHHSQILEPPVSKPPDLKFIITVTLIRPLRMLCTEPPVQFLSLYNSFTFGVLFALFAAYPYVFTKVYGFNTWQNGLAFLGILLGVLLAATTAVVIDRKIYYQKYHRRAQEQGTAVEPEHRLYSAMIGSFGVPIGLFWFAWTARPSVHWICPIIAGVPFAWGNLCIFISAALYLVDGFGPLNGASAMAANGLMRYAIGAVFPLFTIPMYQKLGIAWATSLLGFISVVMIPIPWVLFRFGSRIRARSSYAVQV